MVRVPDPENGKECFGRHIWVGPKGEENEAHIVVDIAFDEGDTDGGTDVGSYYVAACGDKVMRRTHQGLTPLYTKTETRRKSIPVCAICRESFPLYEGEQL